MTSPCSHVGKQAKVELEFHGDRQVIISGNIMHKNLKVMIELK